MSIRALFSFMLVGAAAACAQSPRADQPQETEQEAATEVASSQTAAPACWLRGDPARVAQRASTLDSVTATVDGKAIKLCYSRPKANGRVVMGGLVPYDQPWRLGANEATAIHMPAAGTIAGVAVAAGTYSLYATPGAKEWRIHVNRNAQRWGIPLNDVVRGNDVGTGTVVPEAVPEPVEALTARFVDAAAQGATLVFEWERTRVRIPVTLR